MQERISVIAIDLNKIESREDKGSDSRRYLALSAQEKADEIIKHIDNVMHKLEKEEPDVMHIFTWREFGISDSDTQFITNKDKDVIKERLQKLAMKYPSLVIVAGTMSTTKHFSNFAEVKQEKVIGEYSEVNKKSDLDEITTNEIESQLRKITYSQSKECVIIFDIKEYQTLDLKPNEQAYFLNLNYYGDQAPKKITCLAAGEHALLINIEQIPKLLEYYANEENVKKSRELKEKEIREILQEYHDTFNSGVTVIQNTCYVFQGDKIMRHNKTTPYEEHIDGSSNELLHRNMVFRPGKSKHQNPVIEIKHPHTGEIIVLGIEICMEHTNAVLKGRAGDKAIDVQFVLSDTSTIKVFNAVAPILIHVDSDYTPKQIIFDDKDRDHIAMYLVNGLESETKLVGPLRPVFAIEKQVENLINEALPHYSSEADKKILAVLNKFKTMFGQEWEAREPDATFMKMINNFIKELKPIIKEQNSRYFGLLKLFTSSSPLEILQNKLEKIYQPLNDDHFIPRELASRAEIKSPARQFPSEKTSTVLISQDLGLSMVTSSGTSSQSTANQIPAKDKDKSQPKNDLIREQDAIHSGRKRLNH